MMDRRFSQLTKLIRSCRLCEAHLPFGPRPVFQAETSARLLIAAQAPGRRVHDTGIPFNDPSGDRLRLWLGIDRAIFYDAKRVALVPMGFCYPGTGDSGDLPPRPECAPAWRAELLSHLQHVQLTLIIGQYALKWHCGDDVRKNLTETVRAWRDYGPTVIPLPHPSPRNNRWLQRNPWFEAELIPDLRERVRCLLE